MLKFTETFSSEIMAHRPTLSLYFRTGLLFCHRLFVA